MFIDVKKSVWERVYIPKHYEKRVLDYIRSGEKLNPLLDELVNDSEHLELSETEEILNPIEDESTIEVFSSIGKLIYSNSKYNATNKPEI